MRKLPTLLYAAMALLLAPSLWAQLSPAEIREIAAENESKQDELVNLEHDTARALQWNNGTLFRRIYGDDFVGVLPSGQLKDKAGWISSIENSGIKYSSFIASDIHVRMFQDTAVVTCLWSVRGMRSEQTFYKQYRVTHVYVFGQRGWQVIASQETLLPG
jgi:ketosteroid isomerase-like protein